MTQAKGPIAAIAILVAMSLTPRSTAAYESSGDPIDLVIVLDTSGTMRSLIDSARVKIWEIVNDLAIAEPAPRLRVGLVTYGNQSGSPASGWVRVEADLTDDLDRISERLFALRGRGAHEYVGRALQVALENLSWSDSGQALQFVFLVGNEAPDQDPLVRYEDMSELARQRGVVLSAVFCGRAESPEALGWKEMATLAEGQFASIDHNLRAVVDETPVDEALVGLGELINETYVPYGKEGKTDTKSRAREDKNARKQGNAVAATRAMTKASPFYSAAGDLVEDHEKGAIDLLSLEAADLPRSLRAFSPEERLEYVREMGAIRDELRGRIAELGAERRRWLAENSRAEGLDPRAFDQVLRSTIRERAEEFGFYFPEE